MSADDADFAAFARDLASWTGVALELYKPKCLRRRVHVRMRAVGAHTYAEYRDVLARSPGERERLHDALTINVTRFYRNPETWDALRARVLPGLVRRPGPVRAWSAGCASGEEAHTIAMAWAEGAGAAALERLTVDATDIDRASLARARAGRYRKEALAELPAGWAERWFREEEGEWVVDPRLHARVRVAAGDLTAAPPPARAYDLVCCRNVVIYFEKALQERLFAGFAEALVPGGILVLGKVETLVGPARERLELVDVRERIYRRPA